MRINNMVQKRMSFAWLLFLLVSTTLTANTIDMLDIVRDGKPMATIVLAPDAEKCLTDAVKVLCDSLAESSSARLSVSSTVPGTGTVIYVGAGSWLESFKVKQKGLDDNGFEILFPDKRSMLILGPTDWGTEFGIYEFLERYVGVRWLMPGREGTHIPQCKTIVVPVVDIRQEPAFSSRYFSGILWRWSRRVGRIRAGFMRMKFHHNLCHLFPAKTYKSTHPEFYPFRDGKRQLPISDTDEKWQPCFSAPGLAEEAAKNIIRYFKKNPSHSYSYSLGINDSKEDFWCQCKACRAQYNGKNNSLGMPDYSDIYYKWCNKVIDIVVKQYPDALFGCLVYNNVYDPPSIAVHPRLVPYLVMGRMQWADPKRRKTDMVFQQRWQNISAQLGWYDYVYGKQYSLPRVYSHLMADNLCYAQQNGVKHFYAEASSPSSQNWGEGPKLYVTLKLLWNPSLDVDTLLREWYVCFAGKDAADDLAAYYQFWEIFWTKRVLKSKWFGDTDSPGYKMVQYLNFDGIGYHGLVKPLEMAQCRQWRESALSKTQTQQQRIRVQSLLNGFERYENTYVSSLASLSNQPPKTALSTVLKGNISARLRKKVKELLGVFQGQKPLISNNMSLENSNDNKPCNWHLWAKYNKGEVKLLKSPKARTGKKCLLVKGLYRGGPVQVIPARPGRYVMVTSYMMPLKQRRRNINMSIVLKDINGKCLKTDNYSVELVPGPKWETIVRFFVVPKQIRAQAVVNIQFAALLGMMKPEDKVYLDDIGIYYLDDMGQNSKLSKPLRISFEKSEGYNVGSTKPKGWKIWHNNNKKYRITGKDNQIPVVPDGTQMFRVSTSPIKPSCGASKKIFDETLQEFYVAASLAYISDIPKNMNYGFARLMLHRNDYLWNGIEIGFIRKNNACYAGYRDGSKWKILDLDLNKPGIQEAEAKVFYRFFIHVYANGKLYDLEVYDLSGKLKGRAKNIKAHVKTNFNTITIYLHPFKEEGKQNILYVDDLVVDLKPIKLK